ncbi:MAG TPA: hypothetical protein VM537_06910 [Anaerolineae bacterium]|nr:hypothetical protein [Anaerolineae bacterium]
MAIARTAKAPKTARVITNETETISAALDATAASSGISDARLDLLIALVNELRLVVITANLSL